MPALIMQLRFAPMEKSHAAAIVTWRYDSPYDVYDVRDQAKAASLGVLSNPANHFYALLSGEELIGFRSFGPDGQVSGGHYPEGFLDTGGGLRPDHTGRGLGAQALSFGLQWGQERFAVSAFRVTVAAFNVRALKVCQKVGFRLDHKFKRSTDGEAFLVLTIGGESPLAQ